MWIACPAEVLGLFLLSGIYLVDFLVDTPLMLLLLVTNTPSVVLAFLPMLLLLLFSFSSLILTT